MKFLKVCGMDTWNLKRVAKWVILYHARYDGFKLNNDCRQPLLRYSYQDDTALLFRSKNRENVAGIKKCLKRNSYDEATIE